MEWLKDIFKNIGDAIGLSASTTAYIALAILVVLIAVIVIVAVAVSKKKKAAKAKKAVSAAPVEEQPTAQQTVNKTEIKTVSEKEPEPVKAQEQAAEPEIETAKEETVSEEPVAPVQEKATEKPSTKKKETKPAAKKQEEKPAENPAKKVAAKSETQEEKAKPAAKNGKAKALGKWTVQRKSEDEYISALSASNGEIMLTSETYVSEEGAKKGIATIIKAVENGEFVIHKTKNGTFYFKLKSASNRLLCAGEIYKDKAGCAGAIESVKRIAAESPIAEEIAEGEKYLDYTPVKLSEEDLEKSAAGKWKIETTEDGKFYSTLYASNGQIMLSTEEVATKTSAASAIDNVKKNALAGNFVIDKDKFGKFYYKLRNSQKSVICIGESYSTADRCISALESVRKFAANSPIVAEQQQTENGETK